MIRFENVHQLEDQAVHFVAELLGPFVMHFLPSVAENAIWCGGITADDFAIHFHLLARQIHVAIHRAKWCFAAFPNQICFTDAP